MNTCRECLAEIPPTGKPGRPASICDACKSGETAPEARVAAARARQAHDETEARTEAQAWRDAYVELLDEKFGVTMAPSTRRLPWE